MLNLREDIQPNKEEMMYTERCTLEGRTGIAWLDKKEPYAVIANKALYERGEISRFAVVNTSARFVDSIYDSRKAAASYIRKKARSVTHSS